MAFDYDAITSTASTLLKNFGQTITVTYSTSESYDVKQQKNVKNTNTFTGFGVLTTFKTTEIDGENIKSSDIKLILQSTDIAPKIGNVVTADSIDYRVVNVNPKNPAGTTIVYECQLRI